MKQPKKTGNTRQSSTATANHLLWGIVCLGLVLFAAAMWQNIQLLQNENDTLKQKVSILSSRKATCTSRATWTPGKMQTFQTITSNGLRQYAIQLPKKFDKNAYYPLIVHFPGKSANAFSGAQQAQLDVLPAIIAYPFPTIGKDGYTAWQGAPYSSGADDVGFTVEILDKIQSQFCIDRDRIYATGMSNGGGMVSLLSCRLPDRFAAFGIVAGAMYYPDGACSPERPTPLISLHGDKDFNVPYLGSSTRKLPSINSWAAERAKDNGCVMQPKISNIDTTTSITKWSNCKNNATVESILIRGGGHFWWPESTPLLWQFMSKHSL